MAIKDWLQSSSLTNYLSANPAFRAGQMQVQNLGQVQPILGSELQKYMAAGPYQGPYQAEMDPTRMAGLQSQLAATAGQQQLAQAGLGTGTGLQAGLGTSQDILSKIAGGQIGQGVSQSVLGSYQNPYLDASIQEQQRGLQRQYQEQVAPAVSMAARRGGLTGVGATALGVESGQRLSENLADIEAKNRSAAYNAAYQAAVSAGANEFQARQSAANTLGQQAVTGAQLTAELQKAQLAPGTTQQAVGEQMQAQRQAEIDAQRQAYQDRLGFGFGGLSQYGKAAGILGPQFSASNIDVPSNLQALLSLGGAVAGGGDVGKGLEKILKGGVGGTGGVAGAVGNALRNVFGGGLTPPAGVTEIANQAEPGDPGYGYKYYSDGTVIGPDGTYYSQNSLGDYVAVYGPGRDQSYEQDNMYNSTPENPEFNFPVYDYGDYSTTPENPEFNFPVYDYGDYSIGNGGIIMADNQYYDNLADQYG